VSRRVTSATDGYSFMPIRLGAVVVIDKDARGRSAVDDKGPQRSLRALAVLG
jgi:hypothetical protein